MLTMRCRAGFTLLEVTVMMVLVAILAGVVYTQVVGRVESGESAALAQNLKGISTAALAYRADVGRYPSSLSQLTAPIPAGALDSCGLPVPAAQGWNGPYLDRVVSGSGIASGTATIRSALVRSPGSAGGSGFGTLFIEADGVDRAVARELDQAFDNGVDFATGTIRWTPTESSDRGRLSYAIPVRGC
jgi:general secretion pathway protein G